MPRYSRYVGKRHDCKRCGKTWYGAPDKRPVRCAKCKSKFWNKDRLKDKLTPTQLRQKRVEWGRAGRWKQLGNEGNPPKTRKKNHFVEL